MLYRMNPIELLNSGHFTWLIMFSPVVYNSFFFYKPIYVYLTISGWLFFLTNSVMLSFVFVCY